MKNKAKLLRKILAPAAVTVSLIISAMSVSADSTSILSVTADPAELTVVVPLTIPISISADGTCTAADNLVITNDSAGPVVITDINLLSSGTWTAVAPENDFSKFKANSTKYALTVNGASTLDTGELEFNSTLFPSIASGAELPLDCEFKCATQSSAKTDVAIGSLTFIIDWDSVE